MATSQRTIDFLHDQLSSLPTISARKMFGEYALYNENKVVALVCDDSLFIKPTTISNNFLDDSHLAPPYPGAKKYYQIPDDKIEDREWLVDFIQQTTNLLPLPKPKKPKTKNH